LLKLNDLIGKSNELPKSLRGGYGESFKRKTEKISGGEKFFFGW